MISVSSAYANPVIFNGSQLVGPSHIACVQGSGFGSDPTIWCSTSGGAAVRLNKVSAGNDVVQFRLPPTLGLYAVHITNGLSASNILYLNRAFAMYFDTPQISAGGRFRIFGRNLWALGHTPRVVFVSGTHTYRAIVGADQAYNTISVAAPTAIPLGVYRVYVSNGLGSWPQAKALCAEQMTVRASGPDAFELGVPWAADLEFGSNVYNVKTDARLAIHAAGDGIHNDQPAIQAAITAAGAAGGGVVYLPAGTYRMQTLSGPLMTFASNVVVRGAGQGRTRIIYGYGAPGPDFWIARFDGSSRSGLCDLSIQNLNQGDAWLNTGTIGRRQDEISRIFLARVTADFANGMRVDLKGDRILVKDCDFKSVYTLLFMSQCTDSLVAGNRLSQMLGVNLDMTQTDRCVVENNAFVLDSNQGRIAPPNVRHGIAIGFAHNLAIVHNTWTVFDGAPTYNNDGESILSEGGAGNRIGEETGTVLRASGTSVMLSKSIGYVPGTAIAIIHGDGTGQWRAITARSGQTITVARPWALAPDSTSVYSIFVWSNQNTIIAGNTFNGWLRGIWDYQGASTDTQVSDNRLNNMDGIFMEPFQKVSHGNGQFDPIWNTIVDHNILSSGPNQATYINFTGDLADTRIIGTMALNDQVCDNTIDGRDITTTGYPPAGPFENDPAWAEGYCDCLRVEPSPYDDQAIPAMLGLIFEGNTANDCGRQDYLVNGGDYQTVIAAAQGAGDAAFETDSDKYWNTPGAHGSVGTKILPAATGSGAGRG